MIHTWGCNAATVWLLPPEDRGTQLTVPHFKYAGPTYDDALSHLRNVPGPLLLMLPTDLPAALRRELDGFDRLGSGWEADADGTLLTLLRRGTADWCRWDALVPHLTGRHTYMTTPQEHPRPAWDDLVAAFHNHGILPNVTWQTVRQKTFHRDYWRRVRARLLELRATLRQRWDNLWLCRLDPCMPTSHLLHTCHLCGEYNTVSSARPTGTNRCAQCSQVAACPRPEPPEETLRRRIEGTQTSSHGQAGPAGAALLWIHVHLRDPAFVAHLSHVFAPRFPHDAANCRPVSTMPRRRRNGPKHARARR